MRGLAGWTWWLGVRGVLIRKADGIPLARPPGVWAVVNTQPNRHLVAADNLLRQGFAAYCPMVRKQVRHARRTQEVRRPLFPGYLFVAMNSQEQRWRPMLSTVGVRSLVRFGDRIALLNDGFVESLQTREIDGGIMRPATEYAVGQTLKINTGAFDGLVATIVEMNEKDRLIVLMTLLNRPVRVTLDASALASI